ncbi:hypothetical protein ACIA03_30140 [Nocardioides sp. NPDC051685]|uniref:hypothetical protein n=1 Tax=Nocardioides sp. NPDC051685 TaxID=3364334 RepID=UPI0037B3C6B1
MTATPAVDPIMDAITTAVALGREGGVTRAREDLLAIWADLGVSGDPLHRCVLAHHLADLYTDAAEERVPALPPGPYGDMVRAAVGGVNEAITARDTAPD